MIRVRKSRRTKSREQRNERKNYFPLQVSPIFGTGDPLYREGKRSSFGAVVEEEEEEESEEQIRNSKRNFCGGTVPTQSAIERRGDRLERCWIVF